MRLIAKLTALLMLVIVWVVAAQALHATEGMAAQHLSEMRDDLCFLAGSMSTAADTLQHAAGPERVDAYLARENERLAWIDIKATPWHPNMDILSVDEYSALSATGRRDRIESTDGALLMRLQLEIPESPVVLEFRYTLAAHDLYVGQVIDRQLLFGGVLVCLGGASLFILGMVLVGRPVGRLIEQARDIADGDFSVQMKFGQHDEIGALAKEMNRMSKRVEVAHEEVRKERRARAAALAQVRHVDRLSTVGTLASAIAHELGTPLNVVSGRAGLILASEHCPPDIADDARIIAEQATAMERIIRRPLDFMRRSGSASQPVALDDLLDHARVLLEPLAKEYGVSIEINRACGVRANMEEDQALHLVTNLMVNAIQAMPDGGALYLSADEAQFDKPPGAHTMPGRYACIMVHDHGVGIPADQLERIFEPFFTTKERGQGTGLGLSVCDDIAYEHGGWISLQSEPGKGSTFTVHLPVP